jgi:hypothetical protein
VTTPRRPVVVLAGRQRPHEVLLLAFAVVIGIAYQIGSPPPESIAAHMHHWQVRLWSIGMMLSGIIGLAGLWWPDRQLGMQFEAGAMLLGAGALLIVTAAAFALGAKGIFGGGFSAAWFMANLVRAGQIWRELREPSR